MYPISPHLCNSRVRCSADGSQGLSAHPSQLVCPLPLQTARRSPQHRQLGRPPRRPPARNSTPRALRPSTSSVIWVLRSAWTWTYPPNRLLILYSPLRPHRHPLFPPKHLSSSDSFRWRAFRPTESNASITKRSGATASPAAFAATMWTTVSWSAAIIASTRCFFVACCLISPEYIFISYFLNHVATTCLFSCFTSTPRLISSDAQCLATCGLHVRDEALIERTARNILLRALCAASRRRRTRAPHSGAKVRSAAGRAHLAANNAATCSRCRICSCCSRRSCSLSRRSLHKARRRGSVRRRFWFGLTFFPLAISRGPPLEQWAHRKAPALAGTRARAGRRCRQSRGSRRCRRPAKQTTAVKTSPLGASSPEASAEAADAPAAGQTARPESAAHRVGEQLVRPQLTLGAQQFQRHTSGVDAARETAEAGREYAQVGASTGAHEQTHGPQRLRLVERVESHGGQADERRALVVWQLGVQQVEAGTACAWSVAVDLCAQHRRRATRLQTAVAGAFETRRPRRQRSQRPRAPPLQPRRHPHSMDTRRIDAAASIHFSIKSAFVRFGHRINLSAISHALPHSGKCRNDHIRITRCAEIFIKNIQYIYFFCFRYFPVYRSRIQDQEKSSTNDVCRALIV